MAKRKRAALICRVSRPSQIEKGLESQVVCLKNKALTDGYEVPDELIFQEQITGLDAKMDIRQSLKNLMEAVENNKVDVVYTYELTRISRDPYKLTERVGWFTDRRIPMYIYDVELWTLDRNTKEEIQETTDYVFSAATFGTKEVLKFKKRVSRSKNIIASEGWYIGHLSDGYITENVGRRKKIIIDPERKNIIKEIFDLYVSGKSSDEIAKILNNKNIPTTNKYRFLSPIFNYRQYYHRNGIEYDRNELKWQGTQVSQILANEWYIGIRKYNKTEHEIPAIITKEIWDKVIGIRKQRSLQFRSNRSKKKHFYLLSNYFYCGKCGRKMYGHVTGKDNHYYCSSKDEGKHCGLRGVNKENIEAIISKLALLRARAEVASGNENPISGFFKLSNEEKLKLKQEIIILKSEFDKNIIQLQLLDRRKSRFYSMLADGKDEETINSLLKIDEEERLRLEKDQTNIELKIHENQNRLETEKNLNKLFNKIIDVKDKNTLRKLVETIISRVEIINLEKSISLLTIKFITGDISKVIYSCRYLNNKFLFIDPSTYTLLEKNKTYYLDVIKTFSQDHINNIIYIKGYPNDLPILNSPFRTSVKDFLRNKDNKYKFYLDLFLWEYEKEDFLDKNDDRRIKLEEKHKEWRKKYNTGLPSCLPYVIKDDNYADYEKNRKHLYNRKYKIKKNKSLTSLQKEEQLNEIEKQLNLLKAKVKYLNREEAVKKYKEQT